MRVWKHLEFVWEGDTGSGGNIQREGAGIPESIRWPNRTRNWKLPVCVWPVRG